MEDARQHFYGGGLASTVGTNEPEQLSRFHLERQTAYRLNGTILRFEQRADRTAHTCGFTLGLKCLLKLCDSDGGHEIIVQ